jgi:hypothetical protein
MVQLFDRGVKRVKVRVDKAGHLRPPSIRYRSVSERRLLVMPRLQGIGSHLPNSCSAFCCF